MISIDKSQCTGFGYCWSNCSQVFSEDTDGKAKVNAGQENATNPCVRDAQAQCCAGGILIT